MTNEEIVLAALQAFDPKQWCDDCLSEELGITPRQQVNQICHRLADEGNTTRHRGVCDNCGKRKLVNRIPLVGYMRVPDEAFDRAADPAMLAERGVAYRMRPLFPAESPITVPSRPEKAPYPARPTVPSAPPLEEMFRRIERLCRTVAVRAKVPANSSNVADIITALRDDHRIPEDVVPVLHLMRVWRNKKLHEGLPWGPKQEAVARSAWDMVCSWASEAYPEVWAQLATGR